MVGWTTACAGSGSSWGWMLLMIFGLAALLGIGTWALVRLTRADDARRGT